jgi:50S ribosomal subunit-associated GTPase HflX
VVINKADLAAVDLLKDNQERYQARAVSAVTGQGVDSLKGLLARKLETRGHPPFLRNAASYSVAVQPE